MSFWFTFKEGLKGFKRARLATTITITSIAFALMLVGLFLIFSINVDSWIGDIRSKIELEVFLEPLTDNTEGAKIQGQIAGLNGVESVIFISKDMAAQRFRKEFGRDIYDVLDSNPLPASCVVKIKKGYQTALMIDRITAQITNFSGVTEIVYQKDLLMLIDHYLHLVYLVAGSVGIILLLIAVILLNNTIRLTILARKDTIKIMELVGATKAFIRRPFVIEGFIQGLIGSLAAIILIILAEKAIKLFLYPYLIQQQEIYGLVLLAGILIGVFSSRISVSKYLRKI